MKEHEKGIGDSDHYNKACQ